MSLDKVAPVAIGGVGGSGTRVVAEMLRSLGYYLGGDLNEATDNLWFTLLFKYREAQDLQADRFAERYALFRRAMVAGSPIIPEALVDQLLQVERAGQHPPEWLRLRLASLMESNPSPATHWGWKEPNTHMFLDRLVSVEPGIRYVHVMRNGIDMALSHNQNQLRLWAPRVLSERFSDDARGSLAFWCWAHRRILQLAETMESDFLLINFDDLCLNPKPQIARLLAFLSRPADIQVIDSLAAVVLKPASLNRHRAVPLGDFEPCDVDFVREMGFSVFQG